MLEIERRIAAWRESMSAALPAAPETVRELEEHLREEIERLESLGLERGEAFERAAQRLGEAEALAREFGRARSRWFGTVHSEGTRLTAYLAGSLGVAGIFVFSTIALSAGLRVASGAVRKGTVYSNGFELALLASWIAVCVLAALASRRFLAGPTIGDARGLVTFNLLALWMLIGWWVGPSALSYAAKVATIMTALGALWILRRVWVSKLAT